MSTSDLLMSLLDDEYRTLLTGDYDNLPDIVERKEKLEKELHLLGSAAVSDIRRLSEAAHRNADMIAAANRGFDAARAEIRDIRQGLSQATYNRDGARQSLMAVRNKTERRL